MAIIKSYQLVLPLRNFYMTFHVLRILIKILHDFTCTIHSFITCKHRCLLPVISSGMLSGDNRLLTKPISPCYGNSWKVTVQTCTETKKICYSIKLFLESWKPSVLFWNVLFFFSFPQLYQSSNNNMSQSMTKPLKWLVCPAKTQDQPSLIKVFAVRFMGS